MRFIFLFFLLYSQLGLSNTRIFGSAKNANSQFVYVYTIDDYLTNSESLIYSTSVNEKGLFIIDIEDIGIRKIVIRIKNSFSQLFIQDGATYYIEFPEESIDVIRYFSGSETEILFFNLDSSDINYKILGFEAWMDNEIADLYILKNVEPVNFIEGVLKFKADIQKEYANDTSSFFKDYIKYSLGKNIDNIQYFGSPSRNSKYDFFIKNDSIQYQNPAYMDYINDFYNQYLFQLNKNIRAPLIQSIYNQNANNMIRAISFDSLIPNKSFAELIALKIIQQEYKSGALPKNNLISLTNQIRRNSFHKENIEIAQNLLKKFYTIIEGDPMPIINLSETKRLKSINNRYLYIHVFDPENPNSLSEISAIRRLYEKYKSHIDFVTIYLRQSSVMSDFSKRVLTTIKWEYYALDYGHPIWTSLNIGSFPYYILVNGKQDIIGIPALGPNPNGSYETIEKTFFNIKNGRL